MKSIVFCDADMRYLPPYLALMKTLEDLGEEPVFVGTDWGSNRELFDSVGIRYHFAQIPDLGISLRSNPVKRVLQRAFPRHRHQVVRDCYWRAIKEVEDGDQDIVLWTLNTCSMIALGDRCLEYGRRHVHFCYELEDDLTEHRNYFDGKRFLAETTFVQCEENRADIMAATYGLNHKPFVIPNRPYGSVCDHKLPVPEVAQKVIDDWGDRFVFLYQGILGSDRIGIIEVLKNLCECYPNDVVAVQSHLRELDTDGLKRYRNFSLVPPMVAPTHLSVTSRASIGLAYYVSNHEKCSRLNAIYCAPNKIYEYAKFGVPILGNDIPGLRYSIEASGAGVCFRDMSTKSICAAVDRIKNSYSDYRERAFSFFNGIDLQRRVSDVLKFARMKA